MRPNVVLIVLDTARRDAFEPYGAKAGASPAIMDLARRGFASPSAYAAASWTMPSHVAMFSGLMPRSLGLGQAPGTTPQSCKRAMDGIAYRLLPTVLRDHGYRTGGISTNAWIRESSGFASGFDEFVSIDSSRTARLAARTFKARTKWRIESMRAKVDDGAENAGELVRKWASEQSGEPFFWFVNLVECHSPYLPPRPYNTVNLGDRVRAADEASDFLTLEAIWRACAGALAVPQDALERMKALYADAVRYMDAWVGDLLEALDRTGKLDETVVIVTSDHGENFAEVDGLMAHAFSLDQRLINVPLISAGPIDVGDTEAFGLVDLPRRLAVGLGLDSSPYGSAHEPGIVTSEFDAPAPIDDPRWQGLLAKWGLSQEDVPARIGSGQTAATDGHWKLVRMEGCRGNFFDLSVDPLEVSPVDPSEVEASRRAKLERAIETSVRAEIHQTGSEDPEMSDEERQNLEESMRLLGYL